MRCNKLFGFFVLGIFCIGFVVAVVLVNGGGVVFSSVNESVVAQYNFSVNNTQVAENISEVNLTLPDGFVFVAESNSTDAGSHTFSNTSTVLSWSNTPLVTNQTLQYFWFNATSAATPGDYNFTVTVSNSTGIFETQNLSVTVNDTTTPSSIDFVSPSEANNTNFSRSNIMVNVTAADVGALDTILVRLYNSSESQINSSSGSTSPVFVNFTGLDDGVYYFNATVNDTSGNSNSTSTRIVRVDTTDPVVNFSCAPTSVNVGNAITCSCNGSDVVSGVSTTSYTASPSVSSTGTFSTSCTVTDHAGNSASSNVSYSVSSSSSGAVGYPTYRPSVAKLSEGYKISLGKNFKVIFDVAGQSHILKVDNILAGKVTITISSDPITLDISAGQTEKVDLNADGVYDLSVYLEQIVSSRANFVLTSIDEKIDAEVIDVVDDEGAEVVNGLDEDTIAVDDEGNWFLWVSLLLVFLIVIIFAIRKFRKS